MLTITKETKKAIYVTTVEEKWVEKHVVKDGISLGRALNCIAPGEKSGKQLLQLALNKGIIDSTEYQRKMSIFYPNAAQRKAKEQAKKRRQAQDKKFEAFIENNPEYLRQFCQLHESDHEFVQQIQNSEIGEYYS